MVMLQLLSFVAYNTHQLIIATSNYVLQTMNMWFFFFFFFIKDKSPSYSEAILKLVYIK